MSQLVIKSSKFYGTFVPKLNNMSHSPQKKSLHPRNIHGIGYDFKKLTARNPALKDYIVLTPAGTESIDFGNPDAVFELNKSLLQKYYEIEYWSILKNSLCPPIPGRADYIHYLADLLAEDNNETVPKGKRVRIIDIGTGSSCIYPILGQRLYQWSFVATEIDINAIHHVQSILKNNPNLKNNIDVRLQENKENIFTGIIEKGEHFQAVVCNPPFFKSREDNWSKSTQKFHNLNKKPGAVPVQNFGGHPNELWCEGGERQFVRTMIYQSMEYKEQLGWITSLLSDKTNLKPLVAILEYHKAKEVKIIPMTQGNKTIRILAWKWN